MIMRTYQLRGEEWCILHHARIQDFLYSLYLQASITSTSALVAQAVFQSPVDRHICNQSLSQLHILDIQHHMDSSRFMT